LLKVTLAFLVPEKMAVGISQYFRQDLIGLVVDGCDQRRFGRGSHNLELTASQ